MRPPRPRSNSLKTRLYLAGAMSASRNLTRWDDRFMAPLSFLAAIGLEVLRRQKRASFADTGCGRNVLCTGYPQRKQPKRLKNKKKRPVENKAVETGFKVVSRRWSVKIIRQSWTRLRGPSRGRFPWTRVPSYFPHWRPPPGPFRDSLRRTPSVPLSIDRTVIDFSSFPLP